MGYSISLFVFQATKETINDTKSASTALLIGTDHGEVIIWYTDGENEGTHNSIMKSHWGRIWDISHHPTASNIFATVGEDCMLFIWNTDRLV